MPWKKILFWNLFSFFLLAAQNCLAIKFSYTPMEEIPGFGRPGDFPSYILAVYKFGLWTIGIAALLMIMIGGYMYLTSAGNTAQTGKAKGIITDAIAGIILAFTSWLLLYTINPDLVKTPSASPLSGSPTSGTGTTGGTGTGKCSPVVSGSCSVASLQSTCFASVAQQASSICGYESGGSQTALSGIDKCKDGKSFSIGLFQINIIANGGNIAGCGSGIFAKNGSGTQGNCLAYAADGKTCTLRDCWVAPGKESAYNTCVQTLQNPSNNISAACTIYQSGGWNRWGANSICGF